MPIFHQPHNSIGNHTYNVFIYDELDFGLHFHKNYEFIHVISGEVICCVNGMSRVLHQGDFALCLQNEIHSLKSCGPCRVWVGVFSEDFIYEFKKYQAGKTGRDFVFHCPPQLIEHLNENLIKSEISDIFMIKSCLYALCSEYISQNSPERPIDKQVEIMSDVIEYIENNYNRSITLSELAENLGYEYCYFSKAFNRLFSMSFKDYVNIYRFNAACALLSETDMSITNIAFASGFQSIRGFNYTFKKISGLTPKEFRKSRPDIHRNIK